MEQVAVWLAKIIKSPHDEGMKQQIAIEVKELCARFPVYEGLEKDMVVTD
jgi:glycine/serine hydroxymethyltransferase